MLPSPTRNTQRTPNLNTYFSLAATIFAITIFAQTGHATPLSDTDPVDVENDDVRALDDGRIVLNLTSDDLTPANHFDLNERTLVFTPDDNGMFSRELRTLAWEEETGEEVRDGESVELPFNFDFGGETWDEITVHEHGILTFGDDYTDFGDRFSRMEQFLERFDTMSARAIAPLWKARIDGDIRFLKHADRVVFTWSVTEPRFHVHGVAPEHRSRFQAVLYANGTIAFHYDRVDFKDGIVGLFKNEELERGQELARIEDATDETQLEHLDLTEAVIYETNNDRYVLVEFTTRGDIPEPAEGETLVYRIYFDTDEPFWTEYDRDDRDLTWHIVLREKGSRYAVPGTLLPQEDDNRISMLVELEEVAELSASIIAAAIHWQEDGTPVERTAPAQIQFPALAPPTDLSQDSTEAQKPPREAFHYHHIADLVDIGCRVVEHLGDGYDVFVFHVEFRLDAQGATTPWRRYQGNVGVQGIGLDNQTYKPDCDSDRLKGQWVIPVWMKSAQVVNHSADPSEQYDNGLFLFAHEFTHAWTAHLSYLRDGERKPLYGVYCECHWRTEFHTPAAFPRQPDTHSVMGGEYWQENADGSFTRVRNGFWGGEGFSWLDLYAMGLADASEVPDMFMLRNLKQIEGEWNQYTGEKEIFTIEQIIESVGERTPPAVEAQKDFNAGFVYLVEPDKEPDEELLALHKTYRDEVVQYWNQLMNGRSELTTDTPEKEDETPTRVYALNSDGAVDAADFEPLPPGVHVIVSPECDGLDEHDENGHDEHDKHERDHGTAAEIR